MRRTERDELCLAVANGATRLVQHQPLLYTGRVSACGDEQLTVEAFGHSFAWPYQKCREVDERTEPLGPPTNL